MAQIPIYIRATQDTKSCGAKNGGAFEQKDGGLVCSRCGLSLSAAFVELSIFDQDSVVWVSRPLARRSPVSFQLKKLDGTYESAELVSGPVLEVPPAPQKGVDDSYRLGTGAPPADADGRRFSYVLDVQGH